MKKYGQCVLLVVLFLAFLGCDIGFSHSADLSPTNPSPTNPPPPTNPPTSDLPPKTVNWDLGTDGFYQMYTNESRYYNYIFGVSFNNNNSNKNIYEIEIKKISGARNRAFGMMFGAVDFENYYFIDITVNGLYYIGKCVNDSYTIIQGVADSSRLHTGFNALNTIRVTKSGSNFQVSFNGSYVAEFTDSSITGSKIGAQVWIGTSEEESFPNTPVEVRFRQSSQ